MGNWSLKNITYPILWWIGINWEGSRGYYEPSSANCWKGRG